MRNLLIAATAAALLAACGTKGGLILPPVKTQPPAQAPAPSADNSSKPSAEPAQ
jgi:predicted small lipoprotein YifL